MASFQLFFSPRSIESFESMIRPVSEDLTILEARLLGRADDLEGGFDSAATHFTDIIAWDIQSLGSQDYQLWVDAAVNLRFARDVNDKWADHVKGFWDKRDEIWDDWDEAVATKVGQVPSEYQGTTITSTTPDPAHWFDSEAKKCRELYDELKEYLEEINQREQTNWDNHEENAVEISAMLLQGPTDVNVQKLIDGGYANMAYANLDPDRYLSLQSDFDLSPESAEQTADELAPYWSGDKPLDDRYHELMLVMSMIGTNARNAQNDGKKLDSEEMAFLDAFYDQLETENVPGPGVLGVPGQMEGDHLTDEERQHALGVLGDGLLALSDPNLGGGYEDLPESVRKAAEGPFLHQPGEDEMPYHLVVYQEDARALSDLLRHTDDELQGGYGLSTNLSLSSGAYLHYWGGEGDDGWLTSEEMAPLVDVGTRNKDANYYMLTGTHLNPESGVEYADHERVNAVEGLFTYEWHDEGATARQLTDWLAEDIDSDDYQEASRAGRGFAGFMETMTDPDMYEALTNTGVHVTEGENEYEDASFTHFNTELAHSLGDIFDAHIYSFANSDVLGLDKEPVEGIGGYEYGSGFVRMGPEERAMYMQYLVGNDETAGRLVNSVDVYQQIEAAAFLENGQEASTARGAGALQGLLEEALGRDSQDRTADLDKQVERDKEIAGFVVDEAGGLAEKVPVIGKALSKGMGLASDSIVDAIIDGDYDVSPRHPTYTSAQQIERNFRLEALDYIAQNDPAELANVVRPDEFHTLVEGGAITIERNGEPLTADDIGNDFVFDAETRVTVEKNPTEWTNDAQRDSGLNSMDDAAGNIMTDTEITTSDGRTKPGSERVGDFTGSYNDSYGEVNDFFTNKAKEKSG